MNETNELRESCLPSRLLVISLVLRNWLALELVGQEIRKGPLLTLVWRKLKKYKSLF